MPPLLRALEKVSNAWRLSSKRSVRHRASWPGQWPTTSVYSRGSAYGFISFHTDALNIAPVAGNEPAQHLPGVLYINSRDIRVVQKQEFERWRERWQ
ncbi:MAG: hypothetical protein VX871_05155 [Pseudomonadota bacterium]|nr:hypothetical protein [Pseudomonadota bacterium]